MQKIAVIFVALLLSHFSAAVLSANVTIGSQLPTKKSQPVTATNLSPTR